MAKRNKPNVSRETSGIKPIIDPPSEPIPIGPNGVDYTVSIGTPVLVEMTKIDNPVVEPELPEIKSLSIVKVKNAFALATITTQGKKVVDIQYGEPGGFRYAFEDFKIASMKEFYDKGA